MMIRSIAAVLCVLLVSADANAQLARRGSANVGLQNRSYGGNVNRNVNTQNLNRNVNVNQNVNVDRNVNVNTNISGYHGGCYNCVYHDDSWNWGAFAAGAAATAVVAPAVGTFVTALPGGCVTVAGAGAAMYSCGSSYYRPYYQGTTLVYQVVSYP